MAPGTRATRPDAGLILFSRQVFEQQESGDVQQDPHRNNGQGSGHIRRDGTPDEPLTAGFRGCKHENRLSGSFAVRLAPSAARDPAAAQHQVVLVKHRRLAGRDGALGDVQLHLGRAAGQRVTVAGAPGWL